MDYLESDNTFFAEPKTNPKDRIEVEIGDSKQRGEFFPQVKICRWGGGDGTNEVNLSVRLVHDEANPVVSLKDGVVEWNGEKQQALIYAIDPSKDHPEGGHEFEIVLKEKPDSNVTAFTLNTKGVDFLYQGELTPEEVKQGFDRPENVVGSYAIYASTKKANYVGGKEYKAGKVGHIYRPKVVDAKGVEVWGDLNIDTKAGILSVTIPQDFLDNAVYPVRHAAGLTMGYTTAGASNFTVGNNVCLVEKPISASVTGTLDSVTFYGSTAASAHAKGCLWLNSDGTFIAATNAINVGGSAAWNTGAFGSLPSVTGSTNYVIGPVCDGNCPVYYDSGGHGCTESMNYASPGNLTLLDQGARVSAYATYTSTTTTKTQTGVARIQKSVTQTETGVARITATTARTQTGVADIRNTTNRTQTGVARVQKSASQTTTGLSRIQQSVTATTTGKSRVTATTSQTQTGKGNIRNTTNQTTTGKAAVQKTATQTTTGKSRVQISTAQTQTGVSNVQIATNQTTTGKSRITATTPQTTAGKAAIQKTATQTTTGLSRIQQSVSQTTTGKSRVQKSVSQTTSGAARITASVSRTQTGVAQIRNTTNQTQPGISRVQKSVSQTTTGVAKLQVATNQTTTGKARVQSSVSQVTTGKAAVRKTTVQTETGVARVQKSVTATTTGLSRITKSVNQTQTGKASIRKTTQQTTTGKASVQVVVNQTTAGKAFLVYLMRRRISGRARIIAAPTQPVINTSPVTDGEIQTAGFDVGVINTSAVTENVINTRGGF